MSYNHEFSSLDFSNSYERQLITILIEHDTHAKTDVIKEVEFLIDYIKKDEILSSRTLISLVPFGKWRKNEIQFQETTSLTIENHIIEKDFPLLEAIMESKKVQDQKINMLSNEGIEYTQPVTLIYSIERLRDKKAAFEINKILRLNEVYTLVARPKKSENEPISFRVENLHTLSIQKLDSYGIAEKLFAEDINPAFSNFIISPSIKDIAWDAELDLFSKWSDKKKSGGEDGEES